jgi:hypothetical protein
MLGESGTAAAAVAGAVSGAVETAGGSCAAEVEIEGIQVPVDAVGAVETEGGSEAAAVEMAGVSCGVEVDTGAVQGCAGRTMPAPDPAGGAVETAGAGAAKDVPDEAVWAEAEDDRTAAARTLIRSLFTGKASIPNRPWGRGKRRVSGAACRLGCAVNY